MNKTENLDLITVAIAVYNTKPYLNRCIDSILAQTYLNVEVIIVDDGSTDGSAQSCDNYSASHTNVHVIHKENGGLSTARNAGIEQATGKYICFLDSDDYLEPDYLSVLHRNIVKEDADISVCGYYKDKLNKTIVAQNAGTYKVMDYEQAMYAMFCDTSFGACAWNRLNRMSIINDNNLRYDPELLVSQDNVWGCEYYSHCKKIVYDPTPLYHYVSNESSVCHRIRATGSLNPRNLRALVALRKTEALVQNKSDFIQSAFRWRYVRTYVRLMLNLYYAHSEDLGMIRSTRDEIRKYISLYRKHPASGFMDKQLVNLIAFSPRLFFTLYRIGDRFIHIEI